MNHIRPSLRAEEIRKQMKLKQHTRGIVYDKVVDYIHRYISQKSSVGISNMIYEIPFVVMGLPAINVSDCFIHVVRSLQNDGYCIRYVPPRSIYVSWDISEKGMYMTPNEILMASSNISCPFRQAKSDIRENIVKSNSLQVVNDTPKFNLTGNNQVVGESVNNSTVYRNCVQVAPKQNQMFPWESFETGNSICLLPPPQMTVTDVKTIPIHDRGYNNVIDSRVIPHNVQSRQNMPSERVIRVESIGPGGGLVLNL